MDLMITLTRFLACLILAGCTLMPAPDTKPVDLDASIGLIAQDFVNLSYNHYR